MRLNSKVLTIITGCALLAGVSGLGSIGDSWRHSNTRLDAYATLEDISWVRSSNTPRPISNQNRANTELRTPLAFDCKIKLRADGLRDARVKLTILAPCREGEVIIISHSGLRFSEKITASGQLILTIPALSNPAKINVRFANGDEKSILAHVDNFGRPATQ